MPLVKLIATRVRAAAHVESRTHHGERMLFRSFVCRIYFDLGVPLEVISRLIHFYT